MRRHEFEVGQFVHVLPHLVSRRIKASDTLDKERFEVVRLMPESGSTFQYRIKNMTTGQERLVSETEIRSWAA